MATTRRVKFIDKLEFTRAALDKSSETFEVSAVTLQILPELFGIMIQHCQTAQIAAFQWNKTLTKSPIKYEDHYDIISPDIVMNLPKNTDINEHAISIIRLIENKQPLY